ncbi:hypothetical protein C2G38_2139743 [Gigaspora rosea]|uniref:Uncharacterized protein n=1 Tax=Gigaspora rosea TaxID=44941 RepID=A0A397VLS4_9GLOM|nr:hypothetical protein C2G38_2139743 [Gigaspora rosea]
MYPLERAYNDIEVTLFLPVNPDDRNPESQAIFMRNKYYSVGGKIVPGSCAGKIKPKALKCTHFAVKNKEHVSAELPSMNPMQSKLLNVHRNVTNKFEDHNQLKRKNEEVDAENAEDDNVDDAENAEDNNVDDIEEHQPKAEKFVRENPNSETNIKGKKSSSKTKKHSMRNSKKVNCLAANLL